MSARWPRPYPCLLDYLWTARKTDSRNLAIVHGIINVSVVALFAVAAILMLGRAAESGSTLVAVVALHAFGAGLLGISGWIGGEMVYLKHVGIVPDTPALEREEAGIHRQLGSRRVQ